MNRSLLVVIDFQNTFINQHTIRAKQEIPHLLKDISFDVEGTTYTDPDSGIVYDNTVGIFGRPVSIDFTDDTHHVYTKTNRGSAFMGADTDTSPLDTDIPSFDPAYTPKFTTLKNLAEIVLPEESTFSGYGFVYGDSQVQLGDTIYDLADTSSPAKEVLISSENNTLVPNTDKESKNNNGAVAENYLPFAIVIIVISLFSAHLYLLRKAEK